MAIAQNIEIDQDANYSQEFIAKTDAGVVIDLTNYTIEATIRKSFATSTGVSFTPAKVLATAGTYTLALTYQSTAVAALKRGRHVYDVIIKTGTAPDEVKTRIQEGIATISPSVTRP